MFVSSVIDFSARSAPASCLKFKLKTAPKRVRLSDFWCTVRAKVFLKNFKKMLDFCAWCGIIKPSQVKEKEKAKMKEFKATIVNKMIEKSQDMRIVSLRETAAELGINHISAQDTRDIAQQLRKVEGYHLVQIMNTPNDSLFCSLCLVENGVEFDDGKDFESDAE